MEDNGPSPAAAKRRRKDRIPPGIQVGPASMALGTVTAVIDSHAYILPPFDAVNGAILSRFQTETGTHPTFTLQMEPEPRCFVDSSSLLDPNTHVLKDGVEWSRDALGRATWQANGKRFLKGNWPSHMATQASAYSAEQLVAAMDATDVAISVLHHHPAWSDCTALHRDAVRRYPNRFRRLIASPDLQSAPASVADMNSLLAYIDAELAEGGVVGFQFFAGLFKDDWDSEAMQPLWEHLAKRELAVWFTCVKGHPKQFTQNAEEIFRTNFDKILAWCGKHKSTDAVITHGLPWRSFLHADRKNIGPLPKWIFKASECPRLHFQLLIPSCLGDVFDYPYKEVNTMIERLAKRIGSNRLLFGTEMPMLERYCTYWQSVRHIAHFCDCMNHEERALVLAGNARRLIDRADEAVPPEVSDDAKSLPFAAFYSETAVPVRVPATPAQGMATVQTPCLLVDLDAFEANCSFMNEVIQPLSEKGILLRPQAKAHKCSALASKQLALHGDLSCGICCQSVREAEAMYRGGVRNIMVTHLVADAQKAARLVALAAQGAAIAVCVDSTKGLALFKEALKPVLATVTLDVHIDLGAGARCGLGTTALSTDTAVALAHNAEVSTGLRLRGLQAYVGPSKDPEAPVSVKDAAAAVKAHISALRDAGISSKLVVSVAGDALTTLPLSSLAGVSQELQCGAYVFGDAGEEDSSEWKRSLSVLASVTGCYGRGGGQHLVDVGSRAVAVPAAGGGRRAGAGGVELKSPQGEEMRYVCLGEELGVVDFAAEGSCAEAVSAGARLQLKMIGSRVCEATANLHDFVVGIRDGAVEAVFRIDGRGY